jgi:Flp pilus assembly protein TadG
MQLVTRLKNWLLQPAEQRQAERHKDPGTVAFYWDGSVPVPHEIRDISLTGAYLYTPERWYPGTIVTLTLKRTQPGSDSGGGSIAVRCRVVRHGEDGVGLQFISHQMQQQKGLHGFVTGVIGNLRRDRPVDPATKGQALVESALLLPVLFLLLVNAVNFAGFFYAWITVANAARSGAQYEMMGGISAASSIPTDTQVISLVTNDISSLFNTSSLKVRVCRYSGATLTCTGTCTGCQALTADPESSTLYVSSSVDVTYTYNPIIPLFNLPGLGISATLPPTTFNQQVVMRW